MALMFFGGARVRRIDSTLQLSGSKFVRIPQYRPIYTPVHVHEVCGSILFPSSGVNSLVAKLSSGEPGVPGSSLGVSASPLT